MVFTTLERGSGSSSSSSSSSSSIPGTPKRNPALINSISSLPALCLRQASRLARKLSPKVAQSTASPARSARKQLLKNISNTAMRVVHRKKAGGSGTTTKEEEWGDHEGVWQRTILMGDKCQPLDFSGVIYYDGNGKQMSSAPLRSPRASPLPGYLTTKVT